MTDRQFSTSSSGFACRSERMKVVEEFVRREGKAYARQIAAGTLISVRDVCVIVQRLTDRGVLQVQTRERVSWADRPVALYAPAREPGSGQDAIQILQRLGAR